MQANYLSSSLTSRTMTSVLILEIHLGFLVSAKRKYALNTWQPISRHEHLQFLHQYKRSKKSGYFMLNPSTSRGDLMQLASDSTFDAHDSLAPESACEQISKNVCISRSKHTKKLVLRSIMGDISRASYVRKHRSEIPPWLKTLPRMSKILIEREGILEKCCHGPLNEPEKEVYVEGPVPVSCNCCANLRITNTFRATQILRPSTHCLVHCECSGISCVKLTACPFDE